jgi:hypothetical protein
MTRTLKNGEAVEELEIPVILTIKTKCPQKYMLIDQETGEVYTPYATLGPSQWRKIAQGDLEFIWN